MWTKLRQSYQLHGSSVKDKEGTTGNVILKKITELNQSLSETSINRRRQMGNSASIHNDSPIKQLSGSGSQSSGIATDESGTMDSSPLNSDVELSTPEISQKSQEPPVNNGKDNSAIKNHCPLNCCWDAGSPRASLVGADISKVDNDDGGGGGGTLKSSALKQDDPLDKERNGKILPKNMSRDSGLVPSDNEKSPCSPHKPLNGRSASLDSGNALTPTRTLNAGLPQWPLSPPSKMIQGKSKSCFDLGCNLRKSDLALSPTNVQYAGLTKSCSSVHATSLAVVPKDTIIPAISDDDIHGKHHSDQSLALSAKSGVISASMFHNRSRTAVSTNSALLLSQAKCPPRSMSSQALNVNGSTVACKPRELHQHTLPRTRSRTSNHLLLCGRPLKSELSEKSSTPDIHNCNLTNTSSNCTETSPTLVEGCPDALPKEPACPPVTTASNMSSKHLIMEALNRATFRHSFTASLVTSSTKVDDCPSSPTHQEHKPSDAASEQGGCSDITDGQVASLEDYNPSNDIIQDAAVLPKQESVALQQQGPLPRVMDDPVDVAAPTGTSKEKTMEKQPSSEVVGDNYEAIIQDWEEYLQNALPQTNQAVTDNSTKQPCEPAAAAGTGFVQLLEMVRFLECISRVYDERARSGDFRAQQLAGQAVPGTKKATEVAHTKVFGAQDPQNRIAKMKILPMAQELVSGSSHATVARDGSTQCQQQQQQANAVAAGAIPKRRHHTLWPASAKRHSDPNLRPLHLEASFAGMQPEDCIDGAMTLNRHSRAPWKSLRALFKRSKAVKQSHSGDSTYSRSEEVDDIKETEEFSAS